MIDQAPDGGRLRSVSFFLLYGFKIIQIIAGSEAGVISFIFTMFYCGYPIDYKEILDSKRHFLDIKIFQNVIFNLLEICS